MNNPPGTVGQYLKRATETLIRNSVPTPRLDALVLMEFVLDLDRTKILANPEQPISPSQAKLLNQAIAQRSHHVPVTYITHRAEFYGRPFYIDNAVLQPRPETETMIDLLKSTLSMDQVLNKKLQIDDSVRLADVGTGSGAIGITAKLEFPSIAIDLIDIDSKALKVAKTNVVLHTISAKTIEADLLPKNNNNYTILLCNLPYVPDDFHINLAATHEPPIAIYGGSDGLDVYRKLFKLLTNIQQRPLYILTEALPISHDSLRQVALSSNYTLINSEDFIQVYKKT